MDAVTDTPCVLLVDDNADDLALASLILHDRLEDVRVETVGDAVGFAQNLAAGRFSVAVVSERLNWGDGVRALAAIQCHLPECLLFLLVPPGVTLSQERASELRLAGWFSKDSRGLLALPQAVTAAQAGQLGADAGEGGRQLVESLPTGVFSLSARGVVTYANPAVAEMLGAEFPGSLLGRKAADIFRGGDMGPHWTFQSGRNGRLDGLVTRLQTEKSRWRKVRIDVWPVEGPGGQTVAYHGSLQDLSALDATERELARQTEALSRSREELEQLAYAVSHDLQEPLQLVLRHARMLSEQYTGRLDAGSDRFLRHLINNAERMQVMLDDVLTYIRSGGQRQSHQPLDFGDVVDEAAANLGALMEEADARVQHRSLPRVPADRRQMVQLFQNLIGNALKFRREEPPRVMVTAKERTGDWCFAVKDNAIGMDAKHASRIFGLFQRLHTAEEYPGTGIGLAMCKRIVEHHGGQIWVNSTPGKGSTFYFTVAKRSAGDASAVADQEARERRQAWPAPDPHF